MDISYDTEVTGLDIYHGALPYFITSRDDSGQILFWEWDVDPLTRIPSIPESDLLEIRDHLYAADHWILQNSKYDCAVTKAVFSRAGIDFTWHWDRVLDTLLAGHLLASNQPHDLTTMVLVYLRRNIKPFEDRLRIACNDARRLARVRMPDWRIAKKGLPEMPSCKGTNKKKDARGAESESPWKFDAWLPRAFCVWATRELESYALREKEAYPSISAYHDDCWRIYHQVTKQRERPWWEEYTNPEHKWWTVLRDYANADADYTKPLFDEQRRLIESRGLWKIYLERLKLLRIFHGMEDRGTSLNRTRLITKRTQYKTEADHYEKVCVDIAARWGYELKLPKGGNNKSLTTFVFGPLRLPVIDTGKKKKTDAPSLDKNVVEAWEGMLSPGRSPREAAQYEFIQALKAKRQRSTAVTALNGYERFWLPLKDGAFSIEDWFIVHTSYNITGPITLRASSSNPNGQNISDKEGFNLRYCFGPAPGREWWSLDGKNLELRLPAYESNEKELIDLFERPNDPPYYGSEHLLNLSTVYNDIWEKVLNEVGLEKVGPYIKTNYPAIYKKVKNGGFAIGYGAVDLGPGKGTADRTFGRPGAQAMLKSRFAKKEQLNQYWIAFAKEHGYVITMPDKSVDPEHGYPLLCTRSKWGKIKDTVPLNFHIQGTAMQWTNRAMVRCQGYLDEINTYSGPPSTAKRWRDEWNDAFKAGILDQGYHMTLQVHDELVFDFPKGVGPEPWKTNLPIVKEIKRLMELGGEGISIPTPVSVEYHDTSWDVGKVIDV